MATGVISYMSLTCHSEANSNTLLVTQLPCGALWLRSFVVFLPVLVVPCGVGTHEDERTVLFKTKSLDGTKPNTNPKTKTKTN